MSEKISFPTDLSHNFALETALYQQEYQVVAGTDEVGRGPLAGPVVAAAVILPKDIDHTIFIDSKKLSAKKRDLLFTRIHGCGARIGIGVVDEKEIDRINILQASLLAMKISVEELNRQGNHVDFLLVDGKFTVPGVTIGQSALIKGESKSASIAAASIIAKVTRDRYMQELDLGYPKYGFARNSGYPTKQHRQAIEEHGITSHHRKSFKGVKEHVTLS